MSTRLSSRRGTRSGQAYVSPTHSQYSTKTKTKTSAATGPATATATATAAATAMQAMQALRHMVEQVGENLKCAVCLSVIDDPHSLPCGHFYCNSCLECVFDSGGGCCPLCKKQYNRRNRTSDPTIRQVTNLYRELHQLTAPALGLSELSQLSSPQRPITTPPLKRSRVHKTAPIPTTTTTPTPTPSTVTVTVTVPSSSHRSVASAINQSAQPMSLDTPLHQIRAVEQQLLSDEHNTTQDQQDQDQDQDIGNGSDEKQLSSSQCQYQVDPVGNSSQERMPPPSSPHPHPHPHPPSSPPQSIATSQSDICEQIDVISPSPAELKENLTRDDVCHVCFGGDSEPNDSILFCDGCDLAVHQLCYGVPKIPKGDWFCSVCTRNRAVVSGAAYVSGSGSGSITVPTPVCALCPNTTDRALKPTTDGRWIHVSCAFWHSEPCFQNPTLREPVSLHIEMEPKRLSLLCRFCRKKGACLQCTDAKCCCSFHVPCAFRGGVRMELREGTNGNVYFHYFCPKHASKHASESESGSGSGSGSASVSGSVYATPPIKVARRLQLSSPARERARPLVLLSSPMHSDSAAAAAAAAVSSHHHEWPADGSGIVFCTTKLNIDQVQRIKIFKKIFRGSKFVSYYEASVTHVVTGAQQHDTHGLVPARTSKYFQGILARKWVLCFDWIDECTRRKELLPEDLFIVQGDSSGLGGPQRAVASTESLFLRHSFVLIGKFDTVNRELVKSLIETGGGVVIMNANEAFSVLQALHETYALTSQDIIGGDDDDDDDADDDDSGSASSILRQELSKWCILRCSDTSPTSKSDKKDIARFHHEFHVNRITSLTWLFDCISSYRLFPIERV
jgi:PHD-zinc-finger like domain/PHD-finger/Zinc finger, C3HC4 type (RING finger)